MNADQRSEDNDLRLISVAEAARITGLGLKRIRYLIDQGHLKTCVVPGCKRPRILRQTLARTIKSLESEH